jgi:uncharacterized protein (DUF427 family)
MPKAIWNGVVLAESNQTVVVEGNHYFPVNAINREYFKESSHHTTCHWKGGSQLLHPGGKRPEKRKCGVVLPNALRQGQSN